MHALVIHQFGDPRLLKFEERSTPEPTGDQVLVAIKAAAINPSDVKNVQGKMHGTTLPRIPGRDFAGVIARGAGKTGEQVWGTGGDIGFTRDGSHAEFILLPASAVAPKPAALSMEAAGSAGVTFVTAWSAMVTAANISSGEIVVIFGAAGGVGSAAVQIAKSRGATVIAVVRSDSDVAASRQNGADEAVNSKSSNVIDGVRGIAKDGAHVAFDTTGMMFAEAVDLTRLSGRIPVITAPPDGMASFNLRDVYRKALRILGVDTRRLDAVACAALLAQMSGHFESGKFTARPGKLFPLSSAVEAYQTAAHGGERITLQTNIGGNN